MNLQTMSAVKFYPYAAAMLAFAVYMMMADYSNPHTRKMQALQELIGTQAMTISFRLLGVIIICLVAYNIFQRHKHKNSGAGRTHG